MAHARYELQLFFFNFNKKVISTYFLTTLLINKLGLLSWSVDVATMRNVLKETFICSCNNCVAYQFPYNPILLIVTGPYYPRPTA